MDSEALLELIKSRRSVRRFSPESVDDETIQALLEAARWAPSNTNRQGWHFVVIKAVSVIASIKAAVEEALDKAMSRTESSGEWLSSYRENFLVFENAPVIIAALYKKPARFNTELFGLDEENAHMSGELISVAMAVQNILLALPVLGLGGVVMTSPLIAYGSIKKIIGCPRKMRLACLVALGYPAEVPAAPARKPVDEMVTIIN